MMNHDSDAYMREAHARGMISTDEYNMYLSYGSTDYLFTPEYEALMEREYPSEPDQKVENVNDDRCVELTEDEVDFGGSEDDNDTEENENAEPAAKTQHFALDDQNDDHDTEMGKEITEIYERSWVDITVTTRASFVMPPPPPLGLPPMTMSKSTPVGEADNAAPTTPPSASSKMRKSKENTPSKRPRPPPPARKLPTKPTMSTRVDNRPAIGPPVPKNKCKPKAEGKLPTKPTMSMCKPKAEEKLMNPLPKHDKPTLTTQDKSIPPWRRHTCTAFRYLNQ
eukprot:TRINITY_DN27718_c0_g1_i1.p1 TRINITY_DN27718_c0_g1~~TRINITY_DN27718_c0_g1_i1.p1  ORF type:complete len:281 (+),score=63.22 TRINITY_DN27718_c0_g1_i1:181-1023(+)